MNRPVSPLLHDYKHSTSHPEKKASSARWFAFGLGIPLIGVALVFAINGSSSETIGVGPEQAAALVRTKPAINLETLDFLQLAETPTTSLASPTSTSGTAIAPAAEVYDDFRIPMLPLDPEFETLTLVIRSGDTLDRLFRKNNLNLGDLSRISRLQGASQHMRVLRPGDALEIMHDSGKLVSVYRKLNLTSALQITRSANEFIAKIVERPIELRRRRAYGRIDSSLFESGSAAGLPDRLLMNLAGIFAWDIDFVLDIRRGDDYYLLYEEIYQDGQFVTDGEIIAAEFNNNGRTYQAVRFVNGDGRTDYFTPDGKSVRKAFVRAPVDFTRISSSFNPNRRHPVLNTIRAHRGVDYAAPKGTPIKAAGDGKVIFRGVKGGYGNAVILQHGGNITTLYAHMSSFARTARVGGRVIQGQVIGYVGSTGLATAAHLHYEYRLNGVHRNPRTVALPQADPIAEKYRAEFLAQAEPILAELLQYKNMQIASLTLD